VFTGFETRPIYFHLTTISTYTPNPTPLQAINYICLHTESQTKLSKRTESRFPRLIITTHPAIGRL
jgi:hypothetical protein